MAEPWLNDTPISGAAPWTRDTPLSPGSQFRAPPSSVAPLMGAIEALTPEERQRLSQQMLATMQGAGLGPEPLALPPLLPQFDFLAANAAAEAESDRMRPGYLSALAQGPTLGAADEIGGLFGGIGALFDPNRTFAEGYDQTRGDMLRDLAYTRERDPIGAAAAEIFGGVPLMAIPGAFAARGGSLIGQAARAAGAGAGAGYAYGFNTAEPDERRLIAGIDDMVLGAGLGAGGALLGRAVGAGVRAVTGRGGPPIRTADEIREASRARYAASTANDLPGNARTVVDGDRFIDMAVDINNYYDRRLANLPDPKRYQFSREAADWVWEAAGRGDYSLGQLDTVRQTLGDFRSDAFRGGNLADMGRVDDMIEMFDGWLDSLGPGDVVGAGDIQTAVRELTEARREWRAYKKTFEIERLLVNAETAAAARYTGNAGFETAVRQKFSALAQNPRRMAAFTPEEQEAIRLVARGGPIQNGLRKLGAFAPRGFFSTGAALYGLANTDPLMIALSAFGELGRRGADALGRRNVRNLLSLVSNPTAPPPLIPPMSRGGPALGTTAGLAAMPAIEPPTRFEPWLLDLLAEAPRLPAR